MVLGEQTLKELWLEVGTKEAASAAIVNQYFDVIVEGSTATFLANSQSQNILSPKSDDAIEKNKASKRFTESASAIKQPRI